MINKKRLTQPSKRLYALLLTTLCCVGMQAQTAITRDGVQTLTTNQNYSFETIIKSIDGTSKVSETYYFPELWEEVNDYVLTFKGTTGDYKVSVLTHGEKTDTQLEKPFIRVEPMQSSSANANNGYALFAPDNGTNANSDKFGYGPIWVAGGPTFGFPSIANKPYDGWNATWTSSYHGDDTYAWGDNFVALAMPVQNKHQITLTTGQQVDRTDFNIKFYFGSYYKKYKGSGDKNTWTNWDPQYEWRGTKDVPTGVSDTYWNDQDKSYKYLLHVNSVDFLKIRKGEQKYRDDKGGEAQYSPAWNNGNLCPEENLFDSDLPTLPNDYTFQLTIDLTSGLGSGDDKFRSVPVNVEIKKRVYDGTTAAASGNYVVYLNTGDTKRISLRDALRFDCDVPYADSYSTDYTSMHHDGKFQKLVIHGNLNEADMAFLHWLLKTDRVGELDLSDAKIYNNEIPANFAYFNVDETIDNKAKVSYFEGETVPTENNDTEDLNNNTKLTKVTLPLSLTSIGENAFRRCASLTEVSFPDGSSNLNYIHASAFMRCTSLQTIETSGMTNDGITVEQDAFNFCRKLSSTQINRLLPKINARINAYTFANCTYNNGDGDGNNFRTLNIPGNITEIGEYAFAWDTQLTSVTVPNHVQTTSAGSNPTVYDTAWDAAYGSPYPNAESIPTIGDETVRTITGANFNQTNGTGYGYSSYNTPSGSVTYRTGTDIVVENGNTTIGWVDGHYWFNYTFYCAVTGEYSISTKVAINNNTDNSIKLTFLDPGESVAKTVNFTGTGDHATFGDTPAFTTTIRKGYHVMKISDLSGNINIGATTFTLTKAGTDPTGVGTEPATTNTVPNGFNADAYNDGAEGSSHFYANIKQTGNTIGNVNGDDWFNYTFNCTGDGIYQVKAYATQGNGEEGDDEVRNLNLSFDGGTNKTVAVPRSDWTTYEEYDMGYVSLAQGKHVMKFTLTGNTGSNSNGLNVQKYTFTKVADNTTPTIATGTNGSGAAIFASTGSSMEGNITQCEHANTFENINANHCEVRFTGVDEQDAENYSHWKEYRATEQDGWMYLLTKDIYEKLNGDGAQQPYDVCNQQHADVRMHRVFDTTNGNWNTMVLPFDVTTDQLKDAHFTASALYDRCADDDLYLFFTYVHSADNRTFYPDGVAGHRRGTPVDGNAAQTISGGIPFIASVDKQSDDVYRFKDVTTTQTPAPLQTISRNGTVTFKGTYDYGRVGDSTNPLYILYQGWFTYFTNGSTMKRYRSWFEGIKWPSASEAKVFSMAFFTVDDYTTDLSRNIVVTDGEAHDIYNLRGQVVRRGATDTTNLPKGIYIMNGKKMVVK